MPRPAGRRRSGPSSTRWSIPRSSTGSTAPRRRGCRSTWSCAASAACGRACPACPRISASRASSAASSSMAASSASATATSCRRPRPRCSSPRPIGCRAISTGASRRWCRSRTRPCIARCWTRSWATSRKDEAQSWRLGPDGDYTRDSADPDAFSAHTYFMTNPSLSGRGSALQTAARPLVAPAGHRKGRALEHARRGCAVVARRRRAARTRRRRRCRLQLAAPRRL